MRIVYIHQHFGTPQSASGTRSYVFSRHLAQAGHEVTLLTSESFLPHEFKRLKRFHIDGVRVINIRSGYTLRLKYYRRIFSFIVFMVLSTYWGIKSRPDVVFATSTPLTVAFPALVIKLFRGIPFVFEVRDLWPTVPVELGILRNPIIIQAARVFEKIAYHFADRIICISEGICLKISADPNKKRIIHTGCDLEGGPVAKDISWKRDAGILEEFLFVLTGAIGVVNSPQYVLHAARLLQQRGIENIAIAMIGNGSAKEKIKQMKRDQNLVHVYLFEAVPKKDVSHILAASDGGIILHGLSPTYRETASPNKFYDYIVAGLPVIFNFESPLKQLILKFGAGYYVNHLYPKQLADLLIDLSKNPEKLVQSGKNAMKLAEACFDQKRQVDAFLKALTEWPS